MACNACNGDHGPQEPCSTFIRAPRGTQVLGTAREAAPASPPPQPDPTPAGARASLEDDGDPLIGTTLGSFRVVKRLGKGGMGTVYLGEQTVIGSKVAIKVLHDHLASNASLVSRFYAEARAVNVIGHENIVSIFDMNVVPPNRYYLIMEYLEGRPLQALARGPVEPQVAIPILTQVCDALHAAHAHGVVHRDLKPENIFLAKRGRSETFVKVLDFGIAKLFSTELAAEKTSAGVIVGTPEYMAPEQCTAEAVDGRADIYALGIIAYLLATGRLPFTGGGLTGMLIAHREKIPPAPRAVNPSVPAEWSDAIMKAIAKKPADRYPDAAAFRDALEQALAAAQQEAASATNAAVTTPIIPPEAPARAATPEPVHSRHSASFPARLLGASPEAQTVRCVDLSRGGMFLCTELPPPAIFSRVKVLLEVPGGTLPCECEVVRHVTAAQAQAWGMSPGFGVQFISSDPTFKQALADVVNGLPHSKPAAPPKAAEDDPAAEPQLQHYRKRINGDHYVVLALESDADFGDVRARAREANRELEALKQRKLSPSQLAQVETALERIRGSVETLGNAAKRVVYDANRNNFRGVARCISAGLTVTELERMRKDFLAHHSGAEGQAHLHFATGNSWEGQGQVAAALTEYEQALTLDPLNLSFQQRYWALKRRTQSPAPPKS